MGSKLGKNLRRGPFLDPEDTIFDLKRPPGNSRCKTPWFRNYPFFRFLGFSHFWKNSRLFLVLPDFFPGKIIEEVSREFLKKRENWIFTNKDTRKKFTQKTERKKRVTPELLFYRAVSDSGFSKVGLQRPLFEYPSGNEALQRAIYVSETVFWPS